MTAHFMPPLVASRVVMAFGLAIHIVGLWLVAKRLRANEPAAVALGAIGFVG